MLRNKELRRAAAVFLTLAAASAAAGFWLQPAAGVLALVSAGAFGLLFGAVTRERYRRLARLAEEIDRVLHGADSLSIAGSEEGELSILQSEIAKMTLRIREQNDALRREKGRLADSLADVAHQLRTPLTSANLLLSLLEKETDPDRRRALLREAEALFAQMDWLLNTLLKLSRLDAGIVAFRREPVEAAALLQEALRPLLIPMELHNVTFQADVPPGAQVTGDAAWLAEAFRNILKNGMESAGDGGRLEIVCTDTLLYTEFTFRDSGPGFAEGELPHLFDRFYRGGQGGAAGYGIGLALCKTILVRQGASVSAKNHPRGGAVFTVRFPK